LHITHYIAELECDLLGGHIPYVGEKAPTVYNHYSDGTTEKIADTICENCGHHIIYGASKLRKGYDGNK
jgi:hypothetical protein